MHRSRLDTSCLEYSMHFRPLQAGGPFIAPHEYRSSLSLFCNRQRAANTMDRLYLYITMMKLLSTPIYRVTTFALILSIISGWILIGEVERQASKAQISSASSIGGCSLFPADNIWNHDVSNLPVQRNSANYIASIGLSGHLHPDFGAGLYDGGPIGIPYTIVPGNQPYVQVSFDYADESDPGPY